MNPPRIIGLIVTSVVAGISIACIVFFVILCLIKVLWAWTVPDLFPGAVQQGLISGTISWLSAAKIAIVIAVLSGIAHGHHFHRQE